MSKSEQNLIEALNRFNEVIQASNWNSFAAEARAAQEAFLMAMMDMSASSRQDAIEPARRGCDALKELRGAFQRLIDSDNGIVSATDSLIAEFTKVIDRKNNG
jgi:hypothetical protein